MRIVELYPGGQQVQRPASLAAPVGNLGTGENQELEKVTFPSWKRVSAEKLKGWCAQAQHRPSVLNSTSWQLQN